MHSQNDRTVSGSQTETFVGFTPDVYFLPTRAGSRIIRGTDLHWTNGYTIRSKPKVMYLAKVGEFTQVDVPTSADPYGTMIVDCDLPSGTIQKKCRMIGFFESETEEHAKWGLPVVANFLEQIHLAYESGVSLAFGQATMNSANKDYRSAISPWFCSFRLDDRNPTSKILEVPSVKALQDLYSRFK